MVDRSHVVVIFKRLSAHSLLKILAIHLCRLCHSPYPKCNGSTESQNAGTDSLNYFAYVLRHSNSFNSCLISYAINGVEKKMCQGRNGRNLANEVILP